MKHHQDQQILVCHVMKGVSVLFARVRYACQTSAAVVCAAADQPAMCILKINVLMSLCMSYADVVEQRCMHATHACIPWCCYDRRKLVIHLNCRGASDTGCR